MTKSWHDYPEVLHERHKTTKYDILLWVENMYDEDMRWVYSKERPQKIERSGGFVKRKKTGGRKKNEQNQGKVTSTDVGMPCT